MTVATSTKPQPLSADLLQKIHAYWCAANYLSVGQIYLLDNPLLQEPLKIEHIKPRLLGHWGTTPGLNFIYAHLNRVIKDALESVSFADVEDWLAEVFGRSTLSKRTALFRCGKGGTKTA
jgi:phosphoketolase